jgi:formylglycine-generating enzyme required for sulfatase activity
VDEGVLNRKLAQDGETEYIVMADDTLPEAWPTLRGWIQEQQNVVRLRAMLDQRAENWDRSGRPAGLLLSSREMSQVSGAAIPDQQLTPRVQAFLSAARKRSRTLQRVTMSARYAALLCVLAYLGYAYARPRIQTYLILRDVRKQVNPIDGLTYVWIPKGDVRTDCGQSTYFCQDRDIKIEDDFWIGQTEVTNQAYIGYLQANYPDGIRTYKANGFGPQYPATNVDWLDAFNYCAWAGGRLPSPDEWEYAARAHSRGRYITGDTLDKSEISVDKLRPVAMFVPNRFGLFDMSGNAAEWAGDFLPMLQAEAVNSQNAQKKASQLHKSDPKLQRNFFPYPPWGFEGGILFAPVYGGAYDGVTADFQLGRGPYSLWSQAVPTTGFRCVLPVTDLQKVASDYRAFSTLYGLYGSFYHPSLYDPYRAWWYTVYLKQMKNASHR